MSLQTALPFELDFFSDKPIHIEIDPQPLTSDAGLLLIRQFDHRIGLTAALADAIHDPRDPTRIEHTVPEMVRSRIFGILAGYEDQNDHDTLRTDPVFKLIADRSPDNEHLASQPTLSRFENQIDIPSMFRLRDVFVDEFLNSFATPPTTMTFDLDPVDDPAHGNQQLTLFHGHYDQYQYYPLLITSAETDQMVMLSLRHGTATAWLGADDDLEYLVNRVRERFPGVTIRVRGDCGFGVPLMYETCERLRLIYTFGQSANAILNWETEDLLDEAVQQWEETGVLQRLFRGFWYQAGSWSCPRWVVAKVEVNLQGTNRRYVTTNRAGANQYLESTYDEYAMRGESENRNKEFKCGLAMDRLSDHRFVANYFRLYLHACAYNLLVRLRREIACPPSVAGEVPVEALPQPDRKAYANARRRADPLGEGHPATWRLLLIKVAASVVVSCRRIVIRLSGSWPNREFYERVREHVSRRPCVAHIWTG